jgi:hypothetical protein
MDKPAVPKFTSFRPLKRKKSTGKDDEKPAQHDSSTTARSDVATDRRRGSNVHPVLNPIERHDAKKPPATKVDPLDDHDNVSDYFVDRRGDSKNVQFGSIHRYDVPRYRRGGRGFVIGSPSARFGRGEDSKGIFTITNVQERDDRRGMKVLSSKNTRLKDDGLQLITTPGSRNNADPMTEFIALSTSRRDKEGGLNESDKLDEIDYRYEANEARTANPTNDHPSSEDEPLAPPIDKQQERNASLSAKTASDPQDVEAWLALVSHQRDVVKPSDPALTKPERRVVADLRIAILNKALKKVPVTTQGRDRIWMALLEEGNHIWPSSTTASKWEEALRDCSLSSNLWVKHLEFVQRDPVAFQFERCRQAYIDCLTVLHRNVLNSKEIERTTTAHLQLDVLLRFTLLLKDADFTELAFAIWQVLLEFHFFIPPALVQARSEDRIAAIEDFWESEVPRIGELGATGWCNQGEHVERQNIPDSKSAPVVHKIQSCVTAAKSDLWRRSHQCLPASADEEDTNDPFRFIMFSDLREILELLTNDLSKHELFNACMSFFGLPVLAVEDDALQPVNHFSLTGHQTSMGHDDTEHALATESKTQPEAKVRSQQESVESLFEKDAFMMAPHTTLQSNALKRQSMQFADRIIEMLVARESSPDSIAAYHIAFRAQLYPESAPKTAKHYLYSRPSGFQLLNAYALAEAHLEHIGKADRLWLSALQNRFKVPMGVEDAILVWHAAICFHLRNGDESKALGFLATVASSTPDDQLSVECTSMSETALHEIRQELIAGFDKMYTSQKLTRAILYADCLALLCYIITSHDLAEALDVYEMYDTRLLEPDCRPAAELLAQYKADLIRLHLDRRRAFRIKDVEKSLISSLAAFPENSSLLAAHHHVTAQDRVRQLLKQPQMRQGQTVSPIQAIFRIECEIENEEKRISGSNQHTVRAAFSNALLGVDSTVSHVPSLWFRWLHFEKTQARTATDRKQIGDATANMKMVFMEGLKHLPWVKSWIIVGIVLLGDVMPDAELLQIYSLVEERGLRVRTGCDAP